MKFIVLKKKHLVIVLTLIFILTIFYSLKNSSVFINTNESPKTFYNYTIVLDPGHGGIDPGSVGKKTKVAERELNLKIALNLKSLLEATDFNVILTRSDENGLYGIYDKNYKLRDMRVRRDIIQNSNADLVISIHMNSFTNSVNRGAQVFFDSLSPQSEKFALSVQTCFATDLPESNHSISIGDYFILKCTNPIPAILCECGYLSNIEDEALLVSEEHQQKIAYSIFKGVILYLNNNY